MIRAASLRVRRERHPAESLQQDFDRACDLFEAKLLHRPKRLHRPAQASPAAALPTAATHPRASRAADGSRGLEGDVAGGEGGGAAQGGLAFARCWNACISQAGCPSLTP
jgi:hypothetical protein